MTTQAIRFLSCKNGAGFKAFRQYNTVSRVLKMYNAEGGLVYIGRFWFGSNYGVRSPQQCAFDIVSSICLDLIGNKYAKFARIFRCHAKQPIVLINYFRTEDRTESGS